MLRDSELPHRKHAVQQEALRGVPKRAGNQRLHGLELVGEKRGYLVQQRERPVVLEFVCHRH